MMLSPRRAPPSSVLRSRDLVTLRGYPPHAVGVVGSSVGIVAVDPSGAITGRGGDDPP
jgi:hypothetical protein